MEDVQPEIEYWDSSIVAYVLGANPPTPVMEGFIRRIWSKHGVDKVIGLQRGMFLIRLKTMEQRDKILKYERPFFDSKPVVMKAWVEDMDFTKEMVKTIPIWVNIAVDFKYWGHHEVNCHDKGGKMNKKQEWRKKDTYQGVAADQNKGRKYTQENEDSEQQEGHQGGISGESNKKDKDTTRGQMIESLPEDARVENGPKSGLPEFFCTFIYGFNEAEKRLGLWEKMRDINTKYNGPWLIAGDLNTVLKGDERLGVEEAWKWQGRGTEMYVLTRKLKKVKNSMKELNREGFNAIQAKADKALQDLIKAQEKSHNDPRNSDIIREEKQAQNNYDQKQKVYTQFLKQKAKCHWLQEGDQNTTMFHRSIKKRRLQNTVYVIKNQEGQLVDTPETVAQAFQNYNIKLLGERKENREQ
ncbi:Translation initiation factor 2 subunit gamma, partial [Bienertia sinuspersici]